MGSSDQRSFVDPSAVSTVSTAGDPRGSSAAAGRQPPWPGTPEWVGLKWLMSACGQRVCIDRLQSDRPYALECLESALTLGHPPLTQYARGLRSRLSAAA